MSQERPSWSEIDKMRDRPGGRRKRRPEKKQKLQEHSTRYDRYKADLDRLFDQGLAGELLKKVGKQAGAPAAKSKAKTAVVTKTKKSGRIPADNRASASRLKLMRTITDTSDSNELKSALDELVARFGLPDDWGVLVRVLEHDDEALAIEAISRMSKLLPGTAKIPRRFTLKERLRTIGQTARNVDLRKQAESLEERL